MKSIFKALIYSSLFFICPKLFAREIVLIENLASMPEGELLKTILIKKFHLPQELITLKKTSSACEINSDAVIHLCLEKDGELIIKKMDQFIVRNSLSVFLNQMDDVKGAK